MKSPDQAAIDQIRCEAFEEVLELLPVRREPVGEGDMGSNLLSAGFNEAVSEIRAKLKEKVNELEEERA